jgi:heptosyltransferase-2
MRIAVRCPNWVGDTILATPALAALRCGFPNARITAIARPSGRAILEGNPDIDDLWIVRDSGARDLLALAGRVRRERFDLALLLPPSIRAALPFALGGVPERIGHSAAGRALLLTRRVARPPAAARRHQADEYLDLLAGFESCRTEGPRPRLALRASADGRREIRAVLANRGLDAGGAPDGDRLLAAISPGAAYGSSKCWLPERYALVADRIAAEHGAAVLLVGAPAEAPLCRAIAALCRQPVHDLSAEVSLAGLIALCERLSLMVTNDCGAMHVAAAMRTPLVAIFGPTDPRRSSPCDPDAALLEDIDGCGCDLAPCYRRTCPIDHRCMTAITVAQVMDAVERQIRRRPAPA